MRNISKGSGLTLKSNSNITIFTIQEIIRPFGGSCIAYRVSYKENDEIVHYGILKEYCPAFLEYHGKDIRDENGALIIPEEYANQFNDGLEYFKNTYKTINNYLSNNLSASNYHTVQMGLYEGNNTAYTLTSCDYGKSYEKIEDKSLHMLLKIMLSVTKAVEMYHNAGFLHLDIKPKNILVLDDVADLIKLFDFDSLTSIEKIKHREIDRIPVPEKYYVPELNNRNLRNIGVSTDIFEIGAMMFERLFGFAPNVDCISSNSKCDYDSVTLLNGLSPKTKYELDELFKHTLRISPRERYKSIEELKAQLSKLISLTSDNTPYVMNMPKWQPSCFSIGRQDEIREVKNRLDSDGYVFIKAMGGTGKSELAKMYAEKYADEYHTVQFCKYTGSLKSVVSSIEINGVNNSDYSNVDELVKEKNKVLHGSDSRTLLIIDNFNVTYDEYLREFLPADNNGFKVIFTTRCEPANDYYSDKVFELSTLPEDIALTLFYNHSGIEKTVENDELAKKILDTIQHNTLVLVLLAQSIKKTGFGLNDILNKLNDSKLDNINGEIFHEYDFSFIDGENYNRVFAHLNTIFNISNLTDIQKEILMDMSLVANIGIEIEEFISDCECSYFTEEEINTLCSLGWIEKEDEKIISLHPIVSDLMAANKEVEKKKSYKILAGNIVNLCYVFGDEHIDMLNMMFAYLIHINKRLKNEISFLNIDTKLSLGKAYFNLFNAKEAKKMYYEAEELIKNSFRFKPRYCISKFGLAEIEETFGLPDKAIELYLIAIEYMKKTINNFYQIHLDALCGIASCLSKKHDYDKAYDYYLQAYKYTQSNDRSDKFKQFMFPSTPKDLSASVPELCDDLIEVCTELEKFDEIEKYQHIKEEIINEKIELAEVQELNGITENLEKAKGLFKNGNLKEGTRSFAEYMNLLKEEYGEESPVYKELFGEFLPLMLSANSNDGDFSISVLDDSLEFIKQSYGENSRRFAEYLTLIAQFASDTNEYIFAEKCAKKAKDICLSLNLKNTFTYQEANLVLINSLIFQSKTNEIREVVNEIDFNMFKSKSDYEQLVKHAGLAFVELHEYDKAIEICCTLINKKDVTPPIFCMACYAISQSYVEKGNPDDALIYLKKEKTVLDSLEKSTLSEQLNGLYYCVYSWVRSLQDDNEKAIDILNNYIDNCNIDNDFLESVMLCRIYILRTNYYRNIQNFKGALESIKPAEKYLQNFDAIPKWRIGILFNLAICYAANQEIDKGIDCFTKFETTYTDSDYSKENLLEQYVYFIEALLTGGSYKVYRYLEKADNLIDEFNLKDTYWCACFLNDLGVYLSDYESRHTLAREKCEDAKDILEKIDAKDTPLYQHVLKNLDYLNDMIMKEIISDMAKSMMEENKFYNEEDDNE